MQEHALGGFVPEEDFAEEGFHISIFKNGWTWKFELSFYRTAVMFFDIIFPRENSWKTGNLLIHTNKLKDNYLFSFYTKMLKCQKTVRVIFLAEQIAHPSFLFFCLT